MGYGISGPLDCHVYPDRWWLGSGTGGILVWAWARISRGARQHRNDGDDLKRVRKLILTHYPADHVGLPRSAPTRPRSDRFTVERRVLREQDEVAYCAGCGEGGWFYPADFSASVPCSSAGGRGDVIRSAPTTGLGDAGSLHGHSASSVADRTYLLGGDLSFIWDELCCRTPHCRIDAYNRSVQRSPH